MTADFRDRYGTLDRLFHRLAFRALTAQHALADVEEYLFRDTLETVTLDDPVFITALPRSGTTILLRVLWETGLFASHLYRDMPFVLCPLAWNRFSRHFAADDTPRERAHGDGLLVSADSPEAFEEMIWKRFWPDNYRADRIVPWTSADRQPEFDAFHEAHMRKIIALRRDDASDHRRYVSKNNVNIARLAHPPPSLVRGLFVIPFREPLQHAASMLLQHRRFLEIHAADRFVREYMETIGHHDFGAGLKPVDFGGWLDDAPLSESPGFWLDYWIAAYAHVLEHAGPRIVLVSYARLTREPEAALERLAGAIDVPAPRLVALTSRLRPPRTHEIDRDALPARSVERATALHEALEERATV